MNTPAQPNRLIHASSLYLRQHAGNPVDWYEWGPEALTRAIQENKPILLSIGYSACHWCHVMERECFENAELAALMNRYFINIKIDREERPDIDQVYMEAVQAMGINGGWPLHVFLTPQQEPFFGGTYFPPQRWKQVLQGIAEAWTTRRKDISQSAQELTRHLQQNVWPGSSQTDPSGHYIAATAYQRLTSAIDPRHGGLSKAPKFVLPAVWRWLLGYGYLTGNEEAFASVILTLNHIAAGGIYDHVGGGFARYSVDEKWFVPHFEKMLYDNAQLIELYSEAWMVTRNERFREVVYETAAWLEREMTHPEGGYYAALDADSEGEEGKYYTWTFNELAEALGTHAGNWADFLHVLPEGNWEEGRNILFRKPGQPTPANWPATRQKLLNCRNRRVAPACDKKIIAGWNAMTISGLCAAYRAFADPWFLKKAVACLQFLQNHLLKGGHLLHAYFEKPLPIEGFLDDYACTIRACLDLHQCTLDEHYLGQALQLARKVLANFGDETPYLFYTSAGAEKLIARKKEIFDNVIPSSNSLMASNLLVLGYLLDREDLTHRAHQMLNNLHTLTREEPVYMANWGLAQLRMQATRCDVVVHGGDALRAELQQHFHPFVLYARASESGTIPMAHGKSASQTPAVFICPNNTCLPPFNNTAQSLQQLERLARSFREN
ncbi:MAG: hypothetical protein KatS3mg032_0615 [Cyclobacteriaceae bacterium]|nr:MAG: hypothetical protein KatS3mg032_0615 [Cyclobacteriaceae bacterium]